MIVKKIFISYTTDLQVYSDAVFRAINDMANCQGVRQPFGPDESPPIHVCIEKVRGCIILVGIVGFHYGSIPRGEKLSYIELEYQAAIDNNVVPLMFVAPEKGIIMIPCEHLSKININCRKLKVFKNRIGKHTYSQNWHKPEELATAVVIALNNHFQKKRKKKSEPILSIEPISSKETIDPFIKRDIQSDAEPQIQKDKEISQMSDDIPQKEDPDE